MSMQEVYHYVQMAAPYQSIWPSCAVSDDGRCIFPYYRLHCTPTCTKPLFTERSIKVIPRLCCQLKMHRNQESVCRSSAAWPLSSTCHVLLAREGSYAREPPPLGSKTLSGRAVRAGRQTIYNPKDYTHPDLLELLSVRSPFLNRVQQRDFEPLSFFMVGIV